MTKPKTQWRSGDAGSTGGALHDPSSRADARTSPQKVPANLRIVCDDAGAIRLEATEFGGEGKPALRKFGMTAYTGGAMRLDGWQHPVVVDLAGMRVPRKSRPILKDHDRGHIVGHTSDIQVSETSLMVSGVISGVGSVAQEIIATSENGFPWQASIGASADKVVFIPQGKSAQANGREFTGPVFVARKSTLGEVSFVALGADDSTEARVAALGVVEPGDGMESGAPGEFELWAAASGISIEGLGADNALGLRHVFERESRRDMEDGMHKGAQAVGVETIGSDGGAEAADDTGPSLVERLRAEIARETRRVIAIRRICAGRHPALEAQAIEEGWEENRVELAVLRSERPGTPAIHTSRPACAQKKTLEAAVCLSVGLDPKKLLADYGERTLDAAHPLRNIGLKELVAECARMEGMDIPHVFGDGTATIRAGFSTVSLPGILENVMNKVLLAAYENTPLAALDLCSVGTVTDFKEISRYRLLGTGGFEQVAPDGELKHGKLSEQKYSNRADTYGQMLMLTRQDIVNDDLSAFMGIPEQMGRSGAEVIDHLFFTLLLANPNNFLGAGNGNYLAGADTNFGPDSLTQAKTLFRKQKAGPGTQARDQRPINIRPEILLVPVEVETDAELLMGSAQLMMDGFGTKTKIPVDNPHRNKYRVLSAPHLSDSYYTGSSGKAWYLFANPAVLAAFEIVFLNGRRTPVIERVESAPNTLGMGFRSYIDVGVSTVDPRGAVKVKGEA